MPIAIRRPEHRKRIPQLLEVCVELFSINTVYRFINKQFHFDFDTISYREPPESGAQTPDKQEGS